MPLGYMSMLLLSRAQRAPVWDGWVRLGNAERLQNRGLADICAPRDGSWSHAK